MSRLTGRRGTSLAAVASLLAIAACLESIEPTPDSSPLTITPAVEAVPLTQVQNGYSFTVTLRVRNNATRPVYVDLVYRKTDKLIDQKWKVAVDGTPSNLFRSIDPGQTQTILHVVSYVPGRYPLLDKARGLYRVGLRAFYEWNATDAIPAQPAYSSPFVIVDSD